MCQFYKMPKIGSLISILLLIKCFDFIECKPRIAEGSELMVKAGQNVSIECRADRNINWFKLIRDPDGESSLIDEEAHTNHDLQHVDYVEFVDFPDAKNDKVLSTLTLQDITEIDDAGTYVCAYEDTFDQMIDRIRNNEYEHFSLINLSFKLSKPVIEDGISVMEVDAGQDVNITCRGNKSVTWIFLGTATAGIQHTEERGANDFISLLQLKRMNYTDVGYFICAFNDSSHVIYKDYDHKADPDVASIYIYVKDKDRLLTKSGIFHLSAPINAELVIPCKPTFHDVKIQLVGHNESSDPSEIYNLVYDDRRGYITSKSFNPMERLWKCNGYYENITHSFTIIFNFDYETRLPITNVDIEGAWQLNRFVHLLDTYDVVENRNLFINCFSDYRKFCKIVWDVPESVKEQNGHQIEDLSDINHLIERRVISPVTMGRDGGNYQCYITNSFTNSSIFHFALNPFPSDRPHLALKPQSPNITVEITENPISVQWIVYFRAYPNMILKWIFRGNVIIMMDIRKPMMDPTETIILDKVHYTLKVNWMDGEIVLKLRSPTVRDVGDYVLKAITESEYVIEKNITLQFVKESGPEGVEIVINPNNEHNLYAKDEIFLVECSAFGYPLPTLILFFSPCDYERCTKDTITLDDEKKISTSDDNVLSGYSMSIWKIEAKIQGKFICLAENEHGELNSTSTYFAITDSDLRNPRQLQIEILRDGELMDENNIISLIEGDRVNFICRGNKMKTLPPLRWIYLNDTGKPIKIDRNIIKYNINVVRLDHESNYSYITEVSIRSITKEMDELKLACSESSEESQQQEVKLSVKGARSPVWNFGRPNEAQVEKFENGQLSFNCSGDGSPKPVVRWFKDDSENYLEENTNRIEIEDGTISFKYLYTGDSGKYICEIENREGILKDYFILKVLDPNSRSANIFFIGLISTLGILLLICLILVIKLYKEHKRKMKILDHKKFLFDNGRPDTINPDLDLGEQADLLPYDRKFEFPKENIIIDKLLGSGAFGNVFKAKALDLTAGEMKTTVAVKMMKSCNDDNQLKSFITELKIMIHIGRHINIVNLLGACSESIVSKGELLLIVEYCSHGNILEYMRRHKLHFINQINNLGKIDTKKKVMRTRANSESSRSSCKLNYVQLDLRRQSDRIGNDRYKSLNPNDDRSQSDNQQIVNTDMTMASTGESSDNYVNETSLGGRGALCTKDLMHWSYQIANGMLYLSERKVVHGDLAARNILLTDKNIVKISDFGLSKNVYKKEHYKKKSKGLLPVKWSALEVLKENIFSTQSDVWSFGVVLWEIFTLGRHPYPSCDVDEYFIDRLDTGMRLTQPKFATYDIFSIMETCWLEDPNSRPVFKRLEQMLGDLLGDTEKQFYINLNAQYEKNNSMSEYIKNVRTPSYNSRVEGSSFDLTKDANGYELPILTNGSPIIMEEHVTDDVDENRKRRPSSSNAEEDSRRGESFERECLLEQPDYILMSSPTDGEPTNGKFSYKTSPSRKSSCSSNLYQNINNSGVPAPPNGEDPKPIKEADLFYSDGSDNEVFLPTPVDDNMSEPFVRYVNNHRKNDSGNYSFNSIQINPMYVSNTKFLPEDRTNNYMNTFKSNNHRNTSESSSGFGSLGKDRNRTSLMIPDNIEEITNSG